MVPVRVLVSLLTFFVVITFPWWFSVILVSILTMYFKDYYEIIFFGFTLDMLYSSNFSLTYSFGLYATVFLIMISFIKKYIRT
ncbi:MAG: hypothetical protein WAX44_03815 [Minisyncoccia bacterium]